MLFYRLLCLIVVIFTIQNYIFSVQKVETDNMFPNFKKGDIILVEKYQYTLQRINNYFFNSGNVAHKQQLQVERNKLVLIGNTNDIRYGRIIGFEGEKIIISNGRLFINSKTVERTKIKEIIHKDEENKNQIKTEYLENNGAYRISEISDEEYGDNTPEYMIPPDYVFVLSDNRDEGIDSRYTNVDFVDVNRIEGNVIMVLFSFDFCGLVDDKNCSGDNFTKSLFKSVK